MRAPTKPQALILAWVIHRYRGSLRAIDDHVLGVRDATVRSLEDAGLVDRVYWFDAANRWRWSCFYVVDGVKEIQRVAAEIAKLEAHDDQQAKAAKEADDVALATWNDAPHPLSDYATIEEEHALLDAEEATKPTHVLALFCPARERKARVLGRCALDVTCADCNANPGYLCAKTS